MPLRTSCAAPRSPPERGGRQPARETRAGHPGGARPTSAPSDNGRAARLQRPAVRPEDADPSRRDRRRQPGRLTDALRAAPGWDAGSGPRRCRSGPDPARPARGRNPGARGGPRLGDVPGRQCVPAGAGVPATGTLAPTSEPASTPSARLGPAGAVAHPAGHRRRTRPRSRVPRLRPLRPGRAGPGRPRARGPRSAGPLRPVAGARLRARVLRPAALLDRRLRRPAPVAGPGGLRGAAPGAARGGHRVDLAAAPVAGVDRGPLGGRRSGARAVHPRRLPVGAPGVQPDVGPVDVVRGLRRRPAGQLRRRADGGAAGRRRDRPAPGVACRRHAGGAGGRSCARPRSPWSPSWPCPCSARSPGSRSRERR